MYLDSKTLNALYHLCLTKSKKAFCSSFSFCASSSASSDVASSSAVAASAVE